MPIHKPKTASFLHTIILLGVCLLLLGCPTPYEWRHANQWDSLDQIGMAETSQVKLRAAQSRVFNTTDSRRILEAIISTMQDLNFKVDVLDEELGIVSGKLFLELERPAFNLDPTYYLYDAQNLLIFSRTYRTWGPFYHRSDLVRLTVTVRKRSDYESVVRASAQFYLQAVEAAEPYQKFFQTLEKSIFLEAHPFQDPD